MTVHKSSETTTSPSRVARVRCLATRPSLIKPESAGRRLARESFRRRRPLFMDSFSKRRGRGWPSSHAEVRLGHAAPASRCVLFARFGLTVIMNRRPWKRTATQRPHSGAVLLAGRGTIGSAETTSRPTFAFRSRLAGLISIHDRLHQADDARYRNGRAGLSPTPESA